MDELYEPPEMPTHWDIDDEERLPMRATWYFKNKTTGQITETQALVMRAEDWPSQREAGDSMWRPMNFNGIVVAIKTLS